MIDAKVAQRGKNSSTTVFDGRTLISLYSGAVGNALKGFF